MTQIKERNRAHEAPLSHDLKDRLTQLETAVDSKAVTPGFAMATLALEMLESHRAATLERDSERGALQDAVNTWKSLAEQRFGELSELRTRLASVVADRDAEVKISQQRMGRIQELSAQLVERDVIKTGSGRACPPTVARVSFRKNVEVAPFKHEHAEVSVDVNDGEISTAITTAKDLCDEILGVNVTDDEVTKAKEVLRRAERAGKVAKPRRASASVRRFQSWQERERDDREMFGDD